MQKVVYKVEDGNKRGLESGISQPRIKRCSDENAAVSNKVVTATPQTANF